MAIDIPNPPSASSPSDFNGHVWQNWFFRLVEAIRMSSTDQNYLINVSRGLVSGASLFSAYGETTTAGAASGVLWPDGAYTFPPAAGVQMSLVSTSANDTAAGTGARTVQIRYLDANLAEQTETVTMNGVTPVTTVATNIRFIQCMHLVTFGSLASAAGIITATNGGNTYSEIAATKFRCSSSVRMVPAGKRVFVSSLFGGSSSGTAAASTIINLATPNFDGLNLVANNKFVTLSAGTYQDGSSLQTFECPFSFTAGQVVGMTYSTDKAATVVGSWFGWAENA